MTNGTTQSLEAVALDATENLLGTLVGVEKAVDDLVPFKLKMFSIYGASSARSPAASSTRRRCGT